MSGKYINRLPRSMPADQTRALSDVFQDLHRDATQFQASGTGAVARTLQAKNREWLSWEDFGVVADGVTNDATAMQNLINAAESTGIKRILLPGGKAIGLGSGLTINYSGLEVIAVPAQSVHDTGTNAGRAYFTAVGGFTGTLMTIAPVAGASNRALDSIRLSASFICNGAARGILIQSVKNCYFDLYAENATTAGIDLGVIAGSLGEAKDCTYNLFRISGRQVEQPGAPVLVLGGDATANVCLNVFENVTATHTNVAAIRLDNSDNNVWLSVSLFRAGGGTSIVSMDFRGSNTPGIASRDEYIVRFGATVQAMLRGTGLSQPANNITFAYLDSGNGTPIPYTETTANNAFFRNGDGVKPSFEARDASGTAYGAGPTTVSFATEVRDSDASWDGSTFQAKRRGVYKFSITLSHTSGISAGSRWELILFAGAVGRRFVYRANAADEGSISFSADVFLNVGDTALWALTRVAGSGNFTLTNHADYNYCSGEYLWYS